MPSGSDLPHDLAGCHALIEQQAATIEQQQETIGRLSADMALLKRALFGSRRERFVDHPGQAYLFDSVELKPTAEPPHETAGHEATTTPPRRSSNGRGHRVFPKALPRKAVRHALRDEDIPDEMRDASDARRFFKKTSEQLEFEPASL